MATKGPFPGGGNEIAVSVIFVEDNENQYANILGKLKESIERISKQNNVQLDLGNPERKTTEKDVEEIMAKSTNVPDWIFCDLNLGIGQDSTGSKIAEMVSSRQFPTDILLYSQGGILKKKTIKSVSRYGNIMTANREQIDGSIDKMVWRAVTRLQDPEYMRGLMLSRATNTESILDDCVAELFRINKSLREHFKWELLRSGSYGVLVKYDVLEKYLSSKQMEEELRKIEGHLRGITQDRNLIAHGIATYDGKGGLTIRNRQEHKNSNSVPGNSQNLTRDKIKHYLHLCYETEEELNTLREHLKKMPRRQK